MYWDMHPSMGVSVVHSKEALHLPLHAPSKIKIIWTSVEIVKCNTSSSRVQHYMIILDSPEKDHTVSTLKYSLIQIEYIQAVSQVVWGHFRVNWKTNDTWVSKDIRTIWTINLINVLLKSKPSSLNISFATTVARHWIWHAFTYHNDE